MPVPNPLHDRFDVYFRYEDDHIEGPKLEDVTWTGAVKQVRLIMEEGVKEYIFRVRVD